MRSEYWYNHKLQKYFNEHYFEYEEAAEYYPNPAPNVWKFDIPELGIKVMLACEDDGNIIETVFKPFEGGGMTDETSNC